MASSAASAHGVIINSTSAPAVPIRDISRKKGQVNETIIEALNVQYTPRRPDYPVIVFCHGFGCDKSSWEDTITYLLNKENYKDCGTLTYDLPFSGNVHMGYYNPDVYNSMDPYVEDLVFILEYYKISQCHFICHSISGLIGIQGCVQHKELFAQLVLIGGAACYLRGDGFKFGVEKELMDDHRRLMETSYDTYLNSYQDLTLPKESSDIVRKKVHSMMYGMNPKVLASVSLMVSQTDLRSLLPQIKIPCYIFPSKGPYGFTSRACAQSMIDAMEGNTKKKLMNMKIRGHFPHISDASKFADVLSHLLLKDWIEEYQPKTPCVPHGLGHQNLWLDFEEYKKRKFEVMLAQEKMELTKENMKLREENLKLQLCELQTNMRLREENESLKLQLCELQTNMRFREENESLKLQLCELQTNMRLREENESLKLQLCELQTNTQQVQHNSDGYLFGDNASAGANDDLSNLINQELRASSSAPPW